MARKLTMKKYPLKIVNKSTLSQLQQYYNAFIEHMHVCMKVILKDRLEKLHPAKRREGKTTAVK